MFDSKKCPICNGNILAISNLAGVYECENKCCYIKLDLTIVIRIFDKVFFFPFGLKDEVLKGKIKLIHEEIAYWKENDRYLIKILECN